MSTLHPIAAVLISLALSAPATAKGFSLEIQRNMTCNDGSTIGRILVDGKEIGRTLELPWNDNHNETSRVPAGSYPATIREDGKLGWRVLLKDTDPRKNVELHVGNFQRQTHGCVLVGTNVTTMLDPKTNTQVCGVSGSATELSLIQSAMQAASDSGVSSKDLDITVVIHD
jgi:hypothetical protein